jgi:hypothetical protein
MEYVTIQSGDLRNSSEQILTYLEHTPQHYLPTDVQKAMADLRLALYFGKKDVKVSARKLLNSIGKIESPSVPFRLNDYMDTLKEELAS